jgi:hypothetical protein
VDLAAPEILELFHGKLRSRVHRGADGKGNQRLLDVKTDGLFIEDLRLQGGDGIGDAGREELDLLRNLCQRLDGMANCLK